MSQADPRVSPRATRLRPLRRPIGRLAVGRFAVGGQCLLALLILSSLVDETWASSRTHGKVIAGWVEKVTLEPWGLAVKAKLDTGALTSSIHATDIERFRREGRHWVRFQLELEVEGKAKRLPLERRLARRVLIKDPGGKAEPRVSVNLELCVNGQRHTAEFTLADRKDMVYPVLLGRRFLEERFVVDPAKTFLIKATCDQPRPTLPVPDTAETP